MVIQQRIFQGTCLKMLQNKKTSINCGLHCLSITYTTTQGLVMHYITCKNKMCQSENFSVSTHSKTEWQGKVYTGSIYYFFQWCMNLHLSPQKFQSKMEWDVFQFNYNFNSKAKTFYKNINWVKMKEISVVEST